MSETIKVVVRVRPMNAREKERGCYPITMPDEANNQISIKKPDEQDNIKSFAFDYVFGEASAQGLVYEKTAFKLVQNVIEGYNGTIFAYGQTGCGKTHSMVGKLEEPELHGIIPRTFKHILSVVAQANNKQFLIRCSFIEIYNEEVHDLLSKDVKAKLDVKQSPQKGIFIKDLSQNPAKTHDQLMNFMNIGNKNRSVGQTLMNKDSSRSHSIFMLFIESAEKVEKGEARYVAGKLNLVDLAGSERISKTGAAGQRLKQAQKINLSLSALGNVISALVDGKTQHIPYRDSKLTRLLQDSLGGNTKTVMIANCSPADYNFDETLSTLRYASRAKFIKNKPIINEDPKDALLKEYAQEIKRLKSLLESGGMQQIPALTTPGTPPDQQPNQHHQQQQSNEFKQQLQQKQLQLSKQKDEKKKLQEKIRMLEAQHLEAKDVKVQTQEIERFHKVRESIQKEDIKALVPKIDEMVEDLKGDQLENYKKLCKKQKEKIKRLEIDLRDIGYENYKDKEELLEQIRQLHRQTNLQSAILSMLLTKQELEIIKSTSACKDQQTQQFKVAPFYFKNKKLIFPKVSQNQSLDLIKDIKQNRDLIFEKPNGDIQRPSNNLSFSIDRQKQNQANDYSLNNVIKSAKVNHPSEKPRDRSLLHPTPPIPKKQRAILANASLQPLQQRPVPQDMPQVRPQRKGQLSPLKK